MAKLGMDAGAVRQLAGQLDAQAARIQQIVGSIDGLVRQADGHWHGANGQRFHSDWYGRERAQLLRAHQSIAGLAESARHNADEQQRTSVLAQGGALATTGLPGAGSGRLGQLGVVGTAGALASGAAGLIGLSDVPGKWAEAFKASGVNAWSRVGKGISRWEAGLGRGVGHAVKEAGMSAKALRELKGVGKAVGAAGSVLGGIGVAVSGAQALADFRAGHSADGVYDSADAVGSALKSAKSPIPFLTGAAIATWADDARMAQDIEWDWKWTSSINSHNWTDIVLGGAWDGLKQFPAHVFKDLT